MKIAESILAEHAAEVESALSGKGKPKGEPKGTPNAADAVKVVIAHRAGAPAHLCFHAAAGHWWPIASCASGNLCDWRSRGSGEVCVLQTRRLRRTGR